MQKRIKTEELDFTLEKCFWILCGLVFLGATVFLTNPANADIPGPNDCPECYTSCDEDFPCWFDCSCTPPGGSNNPMPGEGDFYIPPNIPEGSAPISTYFSDIFAYGDFIQGLLSVHGLGLSGEFATYDLPNSQEESLITRFTNEFFQDTTFEIMEVNWDGPFPPSFWGGIISKGGKLLLRAGRRLYREPLDDVDEAAIRLARATACNAAEWEMKQAARDTLRKTVRRALDKSPVYYDRKEAYLRSERITNKVIPFYECMPGG